MIVSRTRERHKPAQFASTPWDESSPQWQQLDQQLAEDHLARTVVEAVKWLDLSALFDSYDACGSEALRPDLMLIIVLIEIRRGRHCPSQWHLDCQENIALQWAGFGICPSRSSWYNFRDRIAAHLEDWNRQVAQHAGQQGLSTGQRAALDGSFLAANASRHRLVNESQVAKRLGQLEQMIQQDEQAKQQAGLASQAAPLAAPEGRTDAAPTDASDSPADASDLPADAASQGAAQRLGCPAWMAKTPGTRQAQCQRYLAAALRLKELHHINNRQTPSRRRKREKVVVSVSDPEAALGLDKFKVFRPLYNVQLMRDLDSPLILGYQVFAQNNDAGTLRPMLERTQAMWGSQPQQVLADSAYITATNLALCEQTGVKLYGPCQENDYADRSPPKAPKQIPKDQFVWLAEENAFRCPENHKLTWIGKQNRPQADGSPHIVHSFRCDPKACSGCPRAAACTTNPDRGRSVKRSEHEDLLQAHKTLMATDEAKSLYRLRRQTAELGFADMKEHRDLRELSGRGHTRAGVEVGLVVLASNLLYLHCHSPPQTLIETASNLCAGVA